MTRKKKKKKISNVIQVEAELQKALQTGEAPAFDVRYDLRYSGKYKSPKSDATQRQNNQILMFVDMKIDGEDGENGSFCVRLQRQVRNRPMAASYSGRLGTIDIFEKALEKTLLKKWPKFNPYINKLKITHYAVHALGDLKKHQVQVILRVALKNNGDSGKRVIRGTIVKEGYDALGLTFEGLLIIYNWFAWRILRRINGEKRALDNQSKNNVL